MKKKFWKKLSIILISLALGGSALTTVLYACAGGDFFETFDSFFAPEVIREEKYQPFFSSVLSFYDGYYGYSKENNVRDFNALNVEEWSAFFGGKVTEKDLSYLLYNSRLGEIDTLIFYLKDGKYPAKSYLKQNTLASHPDKTAAKEFLYYLGFAKRCENYTAREGYWEESEQDNASVKKHTADLIRGGLKQVRNVKNGFIKERYFFQLTRLYYFNGSYHECSQYYMQHADSFPQSAAMKYRSMSYAAGALRNAGSTAKANYLYAQVYDQFDPLKQTAYLSFEPKEETDWQEALKMAKNTRETSALWHLSGIKNDPLRAMKIIYALDPKSDLLELLLVRAINEEEARVIPVSFWSSSDSSGNRIKRSLMQQELLQFVSATAQKENTLKPYLWHLSAGYLYTLAGDFKKADGFLSKAKSQVKNDPLAMEQIRLTQLVAKVEQYRPSEKNEAALLPELEWLGNQKGHDKSLRSGNAYTWALNRLAGIYKESGDVIKARCLNYQTDPDYIKNNGAVDQMIAYFDKPNKTAFDNFIIGLYPYKKETLYDMEGVNLLYQYKLAEARDKFLKAGPKPLESNPFTIRMKDCRDCDQEEYDNAYDNLKFVNEMLSLEEKAKNDASNAYKHYFRLANGYYNMTYFGNCRRLYINEAFDPGVFDFYYSFDAINRYRHLMDCSRAEENYIKAMNATADKELKAKCAFMAAKCEQNRYFISTPQSEDRNFKAGKYFRMLKDQYAGTHYYQEVIKECGYFRTYLGR